MLNDLPLILLRCLALTLLFEGAGALLLGVRGRRDLLTVALVNVMTNPPAVLIMFLTGFFFGSRVRLPVEIGLEILIVLTEGLIYRKTLDFKKTDPMLLSLLLNGLSYGLGLIVNRFV